MALRPARVVEGEVVRQVGRRRGTGEVFPDEEDRDPVPDDLIGDAEGGYRAYYAKDPARGTMQGGNVAGGLGLDREFFESILVPQVRLYGLLGFHPTPAGFKIEPRLPRDWPEATMTRVHLHDAVLELTARADGTIVVRSDRASDSSMLIELAPGKWQTRVPEVQVDGNRATLRLPAGVIELSPGR